MAIEINGSYSGSNQCVSNHPLETALSVPVRRVIAAIASLGYAILFISLPLMSFKDRIAYRRFASDSGAMLEHNWDQGIVTLIVNEPLWLYINAALEPWLSPETIIRLIIFAGAFVFAFAFLLADVRHIGILIPMLALPPLVENHVIHLRQGLALAVFMAALLLQGKSRNLALSLAPLIHSSFFMVVAIYVGVFLMEKTRITPGLRIWILGSTTLVMAVSLGTVAAMLGARQGSTYEFVVRDGATGLGWLFWLVTLVLFLSPRTWRARNHLFAISMIFFYLAAYPFAEFAARAFKSGLPIVLLAGITLGGWRSYAFGAAMLIWGSYEWYLYLSGMTSFSP